MMLLEALKKHWGYDDFRPSQQRAMTCCLEHQDTLVVLPTGGGKSLCYQVPAVCVGGLAVVVSPLISLMKDQVDSLKTSGISAAFVNSTQTQYERGLVAERIRSGELRLLYIAPERLVQAKTIEFLKPNNLSFIAIDEAHCISEWGHDFRPEYRKMGLLRREFPDVSIHAFTATATEKVRRDICEQLDLKDPAVIVGAFERTNLFYRAERRDNLIAQITEVIENHSRESGIIYCNSRKDVESTSQLLNDAGFRTLPYHAGMSGAARRRNQDSFIGESIEIIVATIAFGMGIDKSNVRFVIHTGMPKALENYQQESGRAGRDGLDAECVLLYSAGDYMRWKNMNLEATGNQEAAQQSLQAMIDYSTGVCCRHRALIKYFGQDWNGPCRSCDVCVGDLDTIDEPLKIGQMILSSVVRQGQRFGAEYTAMVLRGSQEQRIIQNRHDELSTHGLLEQHATTTIRAWIEQLISQEFLVRVGDYSVLEVSPRGRQLLKGEETPTLLKPAGKAKKQKKRAARMAVTWEGVDRGLFESLRNLRADLANQQGVPPYIVFTDETLRELARLQPSTSSQFLSVKGVGEKRLSDYGQVFMQCIADFISG
jgi:ATP-dependent DNA helicase RecQ